ncbi:MAG: LPXTG cell wall anchor domain-containing protein [Ilumatobacteraceae bacterium]
MGLQRFDGRRTGTAREHGRPLAMLVAGVVAAVGMGLSVPGTASAAMCGGYDAGFSGGDGSAAAPYQIASASDLATLSAESPMWVCDFEQTADITLPAPTAGSSNHTPIGDATTAFEGNYDGGSHSISDLTIIGTDTDDLGLFGIVENASIHHLTLIDPTVTGAFDADLVEGDVRVGAFVGFAESSSLHHLTATGASVKGYRSVGGIVGEVNNSARLDHLEVDGDISSAEPTSGYEVGGIVGLLDSDAADVFAVRDTKVDVTLVSDGTVGGIVGYASSGVLLERVIAEVDASSTSYGVGGLIGYNDPWDGEPSVVRDAYVTGTLSGGTETGGVLGVVGPIQLDTVVLDLTISGPSDSIGCYAGSSDDIDDADVTEVANFHLGTLSKNGDPAVDCGPRAPAITVTAPSLTMTVGGAVPDVNAAGAYDRDGSAVDFYEAPVCTTDDGTGNPVTSETPAGVYQIVCQGGVAWGGAVESYVAGTLTVEADSTTTVPGGVLPETGASVNSSLLLVGFLMVGGALVLVARRRPV